MDVFHEERDFVRYTETLRKYKERYSFMLYHYVLMTNHVHLVMEPSRLGGALSEIMKSINLSYVQYYKSKYGHIGHFWQDRYKSIIISKDGYLLSCGSYVELNPVRAGIAGDPKDYRWSSYSAYAYGRPDGLTDRHTIYDELGSDEYARRAAYRSHVKSWIKRGIMKGAMDRINIHGNEMFTETMKSKYKLQPLIRPKGRPRKQDDFKK